MPHVNGVVRFTVNPELELGLSLTCLFVGETLITF